MRTSRNSRRSAAKPVWEKWVADNKAKFDSQGVLDALLKELENGQRQARIDAMNSAIARPAARPVPVRGACEPCLDPRHAG